MPDHARDLLWSPNDYLDEVMPPSRDSAEAWLSKRADGTWQLGGPTEDDPDLHAVEIADGQTVTFTTCEELGEAVVTVFIEDGALHAICNATEPNGANWCAIMDGYQADTISGDIGETLDAFRALDPEPDDYTIGFARMDSVPLRFDAATGTFSAAGKVS